MNNFHKEFKYFSWQHFSTQRGVVKISLQAISFYTMIYFRIYRKELGGKIHCHCPGSIFVSFYFAICQSSLTTHGSFWFHFYKPIHAIPLHGIFSFQVLRGIYWFLSTNWMCWQVLLGCLLERSSHRSHGLMKRKEKFWPNCGEISILPVFL